ncbi:hypothetical protein ACIREK_06845 [Streptomyces sp. NPDC102415]|uniref:hypothetical protein n=1 Tax=Streptomyces sp. NPDC102415 TaxID=3366173 RepID=UPI003822ED3A
MPLENDTENNTESTSESHFENDLGEIMRRTGGTFHADRRALLEAGALRGRRKAARRATALTAGVLTLTVLVTAGLYATDEFGGDSASVASATPTRTPSSEPDGGFSPTPGPIREGSPQEDSTTYMRAHADQMIKLLENGLPVLPKAKFSKQRGTSNMGGPGAADASLVFDDSYGASLVAISAKRVDPKDPEVQQLLKCGKTKAGSLCTVNAKGWKSEQGYVGGGSSGVKIWKSTRTSVEGYLLQAIEYNAPSPTGTPTRNEPPLSIRQLGELAGVVEGAFTKYGVMNAEAFSNPSRVQNSWEVFETVGGLLPPGYEAGGQGGGGDEGYVILRDRKTKIKTFLRVRLGHGAADGGKVITRNEVGQHAGTKGLTAETVTEKGLRVTVTSYNAEYPNKAPVLSAPPLTKVQLSAIATAGVWQTLK